MRLNKVIAYLTLSDIFTWGFYSVLVSLSGIYLAGKLEQDVIKVVGTGTAIYLLTNGLSQLPIGIIGDRIKDHKDEVIMLMIGNILMGTPFLFYPIISTPYLYYVLQFILGVGAAINVINWRKLFALNLDNGSEGILYGTYGTIMGIVAAVFGLLAGYLGNLGTEMFDIVIVSIGLIMILSSTFGGLILRHTNKLQSNSVSLD